MAARFAEAGLSGIEKDATRPGRPRRAVLVQRVWKAHGLQPHRVRSFKLGSDPNFADKVIDIVGLYLDPPEHALVFSVDMALNATRSS